MRMTHSFKLSRRMARHRAPLLAALMLVGGACNSTDSLDQGLVPATPPGVDTPTGVDTPSDGDTSTGDEESGVQVVANPEISLDGSSTSGIAMGTFHQPNSVFGSVVNGALRVIWPDYLRSNLAAIKSRGGRVMLDMAGSQSLWKDASGHFSFTKWKARIDRYRHVDFSSYVSDGTIIGHYLIDEPDDPSNWNGVRVPPSTVEAMAKYSKQIWPNLPTIVRSAPDYMGSKGDSFHYLDAAWAQYTTWRRATADEYLRRNVSRAQQLGLALVVGLNITKGGYGETQMTPSQVKSWGSAMLGSSYPCAFLSWQYKSSYLSGSMRDALGYLRSKAQNRSYKSCRG